MRLPFNGSYPTTQAFNDSCCQASYAKFGMKGHNGIDYGLPTGTQAVAAHKGTVYVGYEAGGYGNYIFITGDGYESVYGHLQRAIVSTGQVVQEGQVIAYTNNTGNSSGAHLHFGVRPIGYNRSNGFLGYIDPKPLLSQPSNNSGGTNVSQYTTTAEDAKAVFDYWLGDTTSGRWLEWVGQPLDVTVKLVSSSAEAQGYTPTRLAKNDRIAALEAENAALKANPGDADSKKYTQLKASVKELLK